MNKKEIKYRDFKDKFKGVFFEKDFIKYVFETKSEKECNKVFGLLIKYAVTGELDETKLTNGIRDLVLSKKRHFDRELKKYLVKKDN